MADKEEDELIDFAATLATKKKKKKKKKKVAEEVATTEAAVGSVPWEGTDRDYSYTEMLDRLFSQMRERNPGIAQRKKHTMPPPQMVRVGSRKVMWANFAQSAQVMHRQPQHLMSFVLAELATTGSLDGSSRLVMRGRFLPKQIESLLKKYIMEYVTCHMCKTPETSLTRDNVTRLFFLDCDSCGSRRSVAPIKTGYHATSRSDRRAARS
jgi:translation initiation factor 2 subunit 2